MRLDPQANPNQQLKRISIFIFLLPVAISVATRIIGYNLFPLDSELFQKIESSKEKHE